MYGDLFFRKGESAEEYMMRGWWKWWYDIGIPFFGISKCISWKRNFI